MYKVTPYTQSQAKKIGVRVFASDNPRKKLDVYDATSGLYITSVGAKEYKDFPTWKELRGQDYADKRRELYYKRHKKDASVEGTRGWYAAKLLW